MLALYRLAERASAGIAAVGAFAALLAGLITCADIVIRNMGGQGILGTVDITQLLIVVAAFFTIPYGFMTDSHVAVDVAVNALPARGRALARLFSVALGGILMAGIGWYGIGQANTVALMGDRSQTIALPMIWFWYPLLAGAFFATAIVLVLMTWHVAALISGDDRMPAAEHKGEVL
jgi:TRAP-type C4-dicarboxylate transport system permease small subunit